MIDGYDRKKFQPKVRNTMEFKQRPNPSPRGEMMTFSNTAAISLSCYSHLLTITTMSISFSAPDLQPTYEGVLHGTADYDWALFTYGAGGNDLKVQSTGTGLEDLSEEFMDGR